MSAGVNNGSDITYKIILVGDTNAGKTCIFKKIAYDRFDKENVASIGIDLKSLDYVIEIEENGKKVKKNTKILLNDSAGQVRYREIIKSYINQSNGIIIVYDITSRNSFDNVTEWITTIEDEFGKCEQTKTCMFLIGNKSDLVEGEEGKKRREVQTDEAKNLAEKYGLIWGGEYSAMNFTKNQFDEMIIKFSEIIYSKYGYEEPDKESIQLNKKNENNEERSCIC